MRSIDRETVGKTIGLVLQTWSALALILIILAMIAIPIASGSLAGQSQSALMELSGRAADLSDLIEHSKQTLLQTAGVLEASASALEAGRVNLQELEPLLGSMETLLEEQAPDTLDATLDAMVAAQSGARAMDQVLRVLSSLRFLTGVRYEPQQPLDAALGGVSESLAPLPAELRSAGGDLGDFRESLLKLEPELERSIGELREMSDSLTVLADAMEHTIEEVQHLELSLKGEAGKVVTRIRTGVVVVEALLFQFAVVQVTSWYVGRRIGDLER